MLEFFALAPHARPPAATTPRPRRLPDPPSAAAARWSAAKHGLDMPRAGWGRGRAPVNLGALRRRSRGGAPQGYPGATAAGQVVLEGWGRHRAAWVVQTRGQRRIHVTGTHGGRRVSR